MPPPGTCSSSVSNDSAFRPPVIPRAHHHEGSSSLPVEQWILPFLDPPNPALICISAPSGGGKTTALLHLRHTLSAFPGLQFFDTGQTELAYQAAQSSVAILMCESFIRVTKSVATLELCPWTIDDCLEYLAHRHREQISSIISRLIADASLETLQGSPALLAYVMDQMAADPTLSTARHAIGRLLADLTIPADAHEQLIVLCLKRLGLGKSISKDIQPQVPDPLPDWHRWFDHPAVQRQFVSQSVARQLSAGEIPAALSTMGLKQLIHDIALTLQVHPGSTETLAKLITSTPENPAVPMAASILLQLDPSWRPPTTAGHPLNLAGAILHGAKWPGVDLQHAILVDADFTRADLCAANLTNAAPLYAKFTDADLRYARFTRADCRGVVFRRADLSDAIADRALLDVADFTNANLSAAVLSHTAMSETILTGAELADARLDSADLDRAVVDDADFTNADLTSARLRQVRMNGANWNGCQFRSARILQCNLEGLEILNADFTLADLTGSLFTGSRIPRARFLGAVLAKTGLADITWENADFTDSDLTLASFHLGSSRSGLVGSTIPGEGSRTGFYTDEFNDQDFKSPEEIRKACLVGADLRGANLNRTDFYLVDLRNAKYTAEQRRHLASCGAILTRSR